MNKKYWEEFYERFDVREPSDFARFCLDYIPHKSSILDLGCGNGRDSYFFAKEGHSVTGIDQAVKLENTELAVFDRENILNFLNRSEDIYDIKYCRWLFHATQPSVWKSIIGWVKKGLIMIEARATGDDSFDDDHKRWLVDEDELTTCLRQHGFDIEYFNKSKGLSVFKGQDPLLIRIIAKI